MGREKQSLASGGRLKLPVNFGRPGARTSVNFSAQGALNFRARLGPTEVGVRTFLRDKSRAPQRNADFQSAGSLNGRERSTCSKPMGLPRSCGMNPAPQSAL